MNQESNTGAGRSAFSGAESHRIDVSGSFTGRQQEKNARLGKLIELRQAQGQHQPAANVTVNGGAGCSGFAACKSHRSSHRLSDDHSTRDALRTSAGGAFASIACTLTGEGASRQGAQETDGVASHMTAEGGVGGSSIAPLASRSDCPPGTAGAPLRALHAPSPGLRPDPAPRARPGWSVSIGWLGSDLCELVGFEDYDEARVFFDAQCNDPEVSTVELGDRNGRLIAGNEDWFSQEIYTNAATAFDFKPGTYRWIERLETFYPVA